MRKKLTLKILTDLKFSLINFFFGINLIFCINCGDNFSAN